MKDVNYHKIPLTINHHPSKISYNFLKLVNKIIMEEGKNNQEEKNKSELEWKEYKSLKVAELLRLKKYMSVSEAELQCKKDKLCNFQELLLDWKKFVPIGYKFNPTEHELLKYYLLAKVYGEHTLPGMDTGMGIFREVDVYQSHPAYLPGLDKEEEFCYFFTKRDTKNENGDRAERTTKDGRGNWRMTSKVNQLCDVDNSILGRKNSLVYHLTNPSGGISSSKDYKTNWIMHEYVLDKTLYDPTKVPSTSGNTKPKQLVLCRIYERTKGAQTAPAEEVEKSQIAGSSRSIQIRDTDDNSKRETPKKRKRRPMTTPEEETCKSSCKNRPKRAKTVDEVDMNDGNTSLNDDSTSSSDQASRESQITLHPQEKPSLSRLVKLTEDEKRVVVFSENRKNPTEKSCDKEEQDEFQMINGHVIEDGNDGSRKLLLADAEKNEQNSSEIDRTEEGSREGADDTTLRSRPAIRRSNSGDISSEASFTHGECSSYH